MGRWSIGSVLVLCLLLCACSRNEEEAGVSDTTLSIYVYTPESPMLTRGNTEFVNPSTGRFSIYSLQIWVFEHASGNLVGYFTPASTDELNREKSAIYQMTVTPQFVHNKPNVDVYVLANIKEATCGYEFDERTSRETLDEAVLRYVNDEHDYFGLMGHKYTVVPEGIGLPVSGVLRNQKVTGESPTLRVGDGSLATVQLVRAVSKLRFIFSQQKNEDAVLRIHQVTLEGEELLPKQEYLFLEDGYNTQREYHINTSAGYEEGPVIMADEEDIGEIAANTHPNMYVHTTQSPQDYELMISRGLSTNPAELTQVGPFYLRETDKKLTGKIQYSINNGEIRTATFSMHDAGDFSRNHTWTVYAFYGTSTLEVLVVRIKEWTIVQELDHELYNW